MLAIICGGGEYPLRIAQCCVKNNTDFVLAFVDGSFNDKYDWPDVTSAKFSIGEIGALIDFLNSNHVQKIIFAGHINRPNLFDLSLDSVGSEWLMKIGISAFSGDDALLKKIAELFEREGFSVVQPTQFLQSLTVSSYLMTSKEPSDRDKLDIEKGIAVLNDLSKHDVGQAVIVEDGLVIGIEGAEGTDRLIQRCKDVKKTQKGGVLVKLSKNEQDLRFDMPTIGLNTVISCYESGLNGIAIERGKCIFLNRTESINFANEHDIFIVAIKKGSE